MLSDTALDLAAVFSALAQQRRGILVCADCLSLALAKRLVQIAPFITGEKLEPPKIDYLWAAASMAVLDAIDNRCSG